MTNYHKETGGFLTEFRTVLKILTNFRPSYWLAKSEDENYTKTLALMEELRLDLLKYKKTGTITCKHCNLVESSHPWRSNYRNCPGWDPK